MRQRYAGTFEVVVGLPAQHLVERARHEAADLIVLGRSSKTRVKRLLVGSVSREVVAHAPCPVLAVP